ncbi:hypothetical protein SteCoe_29540 [Stentor coeruleus]|uniref:Uncharacterized protein n=1 Tax=Stentor coeruleus TaxID=5963 RepID=A0A1R2B5N9_9CILI|nr:hypothetical protein SteCoe_29540 [Stentor coeruleus]
MNFFFLESPSSGMKFQTKQRKSGLSFKSLLTTNAETQEVKLLSRFTGKIESQKTPRIEIQDPQVPISEVTNLSYLIEQELLKLAENEKKINGILGSKDEYLSRIQERKMYLKECQEETEKIMLEKDQQIENIKKDIKEIEITINKSADTGKMLAFNYDSLALCNEKIQGEIEVLRKICGENNCKIGACERIKDKYLMDLNWVEMSNENTSAEIKEVYEKCNEMHRLYTSDCENIQRICEEIEKYKHK